MVFIEQFINIIFLPLLIQGICKIFTAEPGMKSCSGVSQLITIGEQSYFVSYSNWFEDRELRCMEQSMKSEILTYVEENVYNGYFVDPSLKQFCLTVDLSDTLKGNVIFSRDEGARSVRSSPWFLPIQTKPTSGLCGGAVHLVTIGDREYYIGHSKWEKDGKSRWMTNSTKSEIVAYAEEMKDSYYFGDDPSVHAFCLPVTLADGWKGKVRFFLADKIPYYSIWDLPCGSD